MYKYCFCFQKRFYGTTAVDASESASAPLVKQGPRVRKVQSYVPVVPVFFRIGLQD